MRPRLARLVLLIVIAAFPGCAAQGLNFSQDKRVTITAPKDRAAITLPLTIRWRAHDFTVTGPDGGRRPDAGYFGIFVDRAPQPPNRTQAWMLRDDPRCRFGNACKSREIFDEADIHASTRPEFTIERLPAPPTNAAKRREFHEATVVLLNGRGERIGESAFRIQFEVDRSGGT